MPLTPSNPVGVSRRRPHVRSRIPLVLFSFIAAMGFLLVNVVDPYAGAVASPTFNAADRFAGQDAQTFVVSGVVQAASVKRDSYSVKEPPPPPPPPKASTSHSSGGISLPNVVPNPGSAQAYAHTQVLARGWSEQDFSCLVALWNQESGWRVNAMNTSMGSSPSTAPYGIPQAYPGGKMASAGADWATNPRTQINWGLGYIAARGTPCSIWNSYGGSY